MAIQFLLICSPKTQPTKRTGEDNEKRRVSCTPWSPGRSARAFRDRTVLRLTVSSPRADSRGRLFRVPMGPPAPHCFLDSTWDFGHGNTSCWGGGDGPYSGLILRNQKVQLFCSEHMNTNKTPSLKARIRETNTCSVTGFPMFRGMHRCAQRVDFAQYLGIP